MIETVSELMAALAKARGGDTILLAPGVYSGVVIRDYHRDVPVIITGPAAKVSGMSLQNASGITFSKIEFFVPQPGQFSYRVVSSKNITFDHVYVHGVLDGNPLGKPSGISILKSSDVTVSNSTFEQLRRGVGVAASGDVVLRGNKFKFIQTDGVMVSDTVGINISQNEFSDFYPAEGDHPDAIQFLTSGTNSPSRNVTISANIAWRGGGKSMQGIFMRDERGYLPYEDVNISKNILIGTGYNGIVVAGGKNITISDNQLFSYNGKTNQNWVMIKRTDGAKVLNNSAIKFGYVDVSNLEESGNKNNKPIPEEGADAVLLKAKANKR